MKERDRVKRFIHIEWGADSHAGRHSEDPEAVLRKVATGKGTDERGLAYLKTGGDARVSQRRRLVGDLRLQSLRLAPEDAGEAALAHRLGAVDIQGLRLAAARRQRDPAHESEGRRASAT